ncbi:MAG: helix-turn-helix transcriptional regulator [Pyrinomonadaceae bacterium]|nr:helix-turn-helix transcriptional regulator [Pyrinomonadaceae bacterium]
MSLELSQDELVERLNYDKSPLVPAEISMFEHDRREPPVQLLLQYARLAGFPMEYLVDDDLDLPRGF